MERIALIVPYSAVGRNVTRALRLIYLPFASLLVSTEGAAQASPATRADDSNQIERVSHMALVRSITCSIHFNTCC